MRRLAMIVMVSGALTSGCAGCGPLDDVNNPRGEGGGTYLGVDAGDRADGGGSFGLSDAAGATDVRGSSDSDAASWGRDGEAEEDLGELAADLGADAGADVGLPGPVCGDAVTEENEACDDGVTTDCVGTHDGGDGVCVAAGTCSDQFVIDGSVCVPAQRTQHVHIHVANDCSMTVDPPELTVPRGQTVKFSWHNHSQSYPVDVWQSYIGGFTDLAPGATWNEQFEWCFNVNPYTGYSDISTTPACPEHRFYIRCNGR